MVLGHKKAGEMTRTDVAQVHGESVEKHWKVK